MNKLETPPIVTHLSELVVKSAKIDASLFEKFNVKRGLRNADHTGVLLGLTNVGDVVGYKKEDDKLVPIAGQLVYRGIEVSQLVQGAIDQKRHGYDETVYLLISGKLPNAQELKDFNEYMGSLRELPDEFVNSMILSNKARD